VTNKQSWGNRVTVPEIPGIAGDSVSGEVSLRVSFVVVTPCRLATFRYICAVLLFGIYSSNAALCLV
jgi:hypothetical protein